MSTEEKSERRRQIEEIFKNPGKSLIVNEQGELFEPEREVAEELLDTGVADNEGEAFRLADDADRRYGE